MLRFELKNPDETKILIGKQGKSMRGFSNHIGVSQSYLSQVLSLKSRPSATIAKKIAEGLSVNIEDIFFITIDNKSYQKEKVKL
ncbi:helix-turn-helix domain-containing protein [Planococcus rifietoensis]|uniref:helix-turn-helix domain-containing protein n=1 Tax=Planococcus rifietoensis TaxID=200991 RepID=UPI003850E7B2